ncbi:hypothetical protein F4553_001989 [Allocatelliglobosispora scoriae]|uniref:PE domain-containing protein n=1 Tax=Allocatelliglobosispora scoriae TaxID=643052 RepID=A0A841BP72_9ACTN|nr:hypothetical protein [Allocatelliglobosispora scoriae]MBB5868610.1 hypothetical protein [Allocatelliglobosispora scoriae]
MTNGETVDFTVDLVALVDLHRSLVAIQRDLEASSGVTAAADRESMGGHDVADAVRDFIDGWRDGRQQVSENLNACVGILAQAIEVYRQAEEALHNAAAGSSTPASTHP